MDGSDFQMAQATGKTECRQSKEEAPRPVRAGMVAVVPARHDRGMGWGGGSEGRGKRHRGCILVVKPTAHISELALGGRGLENCVDGDGKCICGKLEEEEVEYLARGSQEFY